MSITAGANPPLAMKPEPPLPLGPKGRWWIGSLPMLRRDGLARVVAWAHEYDGMFYARALGLGFCVVSRPDLIEDVLVTQSQNFVHGLALVGNKRFLGDGLLTSEGELWRRQRYLMQPAFHRRSIGHYAEIMVRHAQETMAHWRPGKVRDLYRDMTRLTLEIVSHVLFDVDAAGHQDRLIAAARAGQLRNSRGIAPMHALKYFPTPRNLRYLWTTHRLDQSIYGIIRQRRASAQQGTDLLSVLLQARDEDGTSMSDRQVRDEVVTLIFTGSETTALALSYVSYLLALHREAQARMAKEIDEVLEDRPPALDDLPRLTHTEKVIKEALRLYPPVWAFVRQAIRPVELGGYTLPAGTTVVMSQWVAHRDRILFDRPHEFVPERWTAEFEKQLPKFAYFPFGGGQRTCIGAAFAKMEITLLLAALAQRFRLSLTPGFKLELLPSITLQPKRGISAVLHKRDGSLSLPHNTV
ncbi:MAG TPA: cytochrome P450 [Terriglobia bacterium]|nr:cytochrome P450 [Terriglobia bacterium]